MARSLIKPPTIPTAESMMQKIRKRAGLPRVERRKKKRLSIGQINMMGDEQLKAHLEAIKKPEDKRTTFSKVLDVIDIPRNLIANVIGSLTGVEKAKLPTAALGQKRVMMSDVLKKLGVQNKVVRGIAGFVGDVAIDPLLYLSLGAATGIKMGAGLPRFLGKRVVKQTARAMASGGKVSGELAKAIGRSPQELLKIGKGLVAQRGLKGTMKQLAGRKGGWLYRQLARKARGIGKTTEGTLTAAQQFLKLHSAKGRTILRAPFAKKGFTLPWGKQAEAFRQLGDPARVAQFMQRAGLQARGAAAGKAIGRLGEKAAALKPAAAAKEAQAAKVIAQIRQKYPISEAQARKIITEIVAKPGQSMGEWRAAIDARVQRILGAKEVLKGKAATAGAKAQSMLYDPNAPAAMRGIAEEAIGGQIARGPQELAAMGAGPLTRAKHSLIRGKRAIFGDPISRITQREKAIEAGMRHAGEARGPALAEYTPLIDDLVRTYEGANLSGKQLVAARERVGRNLINLVEAGGRGAAEVGYPGAPIRVALQQLQKTPFAKDPKVLSLVQKLTEGSKTIAGGLEDVRMLPKEIQPHMGRHITPTMAKYKAAEELRLGGKAFDAERVRMQQLLKRGPGGEILGEKLIPKRPGVQLSDDLARSGYSPGKSYPMTIEDWNVGLNPETGEPLAQSMIGPGTPKPAQMFTTDVAEIVASDRVSAEFKKSVAQLRDMVMQEGAFQLPEAQAAGIPWLAKPFGGQNATQGAVYQLTKDVLAPGGQPLMMPRPVAEVVDRMNSLLSNPKAVSGLLRGFDTAVGFWKTWALYHPAYLIRNVFQNLLGSTMAGARPMRVARLWRSKPMRGAIKALQAGKPIVGSIKIRGKVVKLADVFGDLIRYNQVGTGATAMLENPTTYGRLRNVIQNKVMRAVFKINQATEDGMKAAAFVDFLDQGMTVRQAMMQVTKAMPDLTHLSAFERGVMRRVFPFYSWYRRNGALQLFHYLPKYPVWAASGSRARRAVEMAMVGDEAVDAQLRPSWQEDAQGAQIMGDSEAGQVFLMASWMPFDEMVAVLGAAHSPQDFMRELLERATPGAKFGAEMAVGRDIFRGRPVPRFSLGELAMNSPKAIVGASRSPLDNLLGIRPVKEYGRRVWEQPTVGGKAVRAVLGGAVQPVSRERGLIARSRELRDKATELRAKLNRAVENRDQPEIELLTRELLRVWNQMMEQGLPGVPKAAQAMMSQHGIKPAEPALAR